MQIPDNEMVRVIKDFTCMCKVEFKALPEHVKAQVTRNDWGQLEVPFEVAVEKVQSYQALS